MLGMLKRHEVEILLKAGHAKTEVSRLSGVSLRSVKRIAEERSVVHVDDAAERAQRQIGRPSRVANFRKPILGLFGPISASGIPELAIPFGSLIGPLLFWLPKESRQARSLPPTSPARSVCSATLLADTCW
jgi:hypothetical protein